MEEICTYQEVTPGVQDPLHDMLLGCYEIDPFGEMINYDSSVGYGNATFHAHGGPQPQRVENAMIRNLSLATKFCRIKLRTQLRLRTCKRFGTTMANSLDGTT